MLGQAQDYFRDISLGRKTSAVQRNSLPHSASGSARSRTAMPTSTCIIFLTPAYMGLNLSLWICSSSKSAISFDVVRRIGRVRMAGLWGDQSFGTPGEADPGCRAFPREKPEARA